jgi:hypothetical protein
MIRTAVLACIGLIMTVGAYSEAQTRRALIGDISIKPKWGPTPLPGSRNYQSSGRAGTGRWYMIQISYSTAKSMQGQKKYNWLDDVTMKVEMLFPGEHNRKRAVARMTGSVEFWSIRMDGKKHNALMLVPPQIIKRYAREGDNYKRIPIYIRLSFSNSDNRLIAVKYYSSMSSKSERDAAVEFKKSSNTGRISVGGILRLADVILSRDKTPWSAINWEHYELIKPKSTKK